MLRVLIRGDSNEYTKHIISNIKKEKPALIILRDFSKGLKNKFETAVVDEPSVFEPPKFYCHFIVRFRCNLFTIVPSMKNIIDFFFLMERLLNFTETEPKSASFDILDLTINHMVKIHPLRLSCTPF